MITMYKDYYLKFPSKEIADSILYRIEGFIEPNLETGDEGDEGYVTCNYKHVDVIGVIYEYGDVVDIKNPPEPVVLDGWHVNIRLCSEEDSTIIEQYAVSPVTPRRTWA